VSDRETSKASSKNPDVSATATPMSTASPEAQANKPSGTLLALGLALVVGGGIYLVQRGGGASDLETDPMPIRHTTEASDPVLDGPPDPNRAERLRVNVVVTHPHDPRAFTQGLVYQDGTLYEATGLYGRSSIRRVDLASGEVLASEDLPREYFGEGLALVGDRFFQLTWENGVALERRREDLSVLREIPYEGEGWGLCYDGTRLVMSDGSADLFFRNADTFELEGHIGVTLDGEPLDQLNELECVDGLIYANVWQSDYIARIDPSTGRVTAWIDTALHEGSPEGARMLEPSDAEHADVLNGIAYVPERRRFLVGGKEWPHLFEVEFVPAGP